MDASQEKINITNSSGEKLVGILHNTGSKELAILCHGLTGNKDVGLFVNLANTLSQAGLSVFRFDFSGNGESEGKFGFANYQKEINDLHDVVLYWTRQGCIVKAILGHSKGGSTVLLYASKFKEVHTIVNASGRVDLTVGLDKLLGPDYLERIEAGPITVKDSSGNTEFVVTKESLKERLNTDLVSAVQTIPEDIRIMSVHGSEDETVPADNAQKVDELVTNHTLHIVQGANHMYSQHEKELGEVVKQFILAE